MKNELIIKPNALLSYFFIAASITACGGGGDNNKAGEKPKTAASLEFSVEKTKNFVFSWTDVSDATHYRLLENLNSASGFSQVGSDLAQGTQKFEYIVPLYARTDASYILQSCNTNGCTDSNAFSIADYINKGGSIGQAAGYLKSDAPSLLDGFGNTVAISIDGNTLAAGNYNGEVRVFKRSGKAWQLQQTLSGSSAGNAFGASSISFSETGGVIAIGAVQEDVGAEQFAGAVYIFTRNSSGVWSQQAHLTASNADSSDLFGISVSLSADGTVLAVGAEQESSNSTGINGDQNNDLADQAGAVYIFEKNANQWTQQAYIKASNTGAGDRFSNVSLSSDGNTLAVGAYLEDSNATGINENQTDNSSSDAGSAYVFKRENGAWSQQAYIKASNTLSGAVFGNSVSLSADGNVLAIGADSEENTAGDLVGAVYLFNLSSGNWVQQARIVDDNLDQDDKFGRRVSLSPEGKTIAIGSPGESSDATGINQSQTNNNASRSGAVFVFTQTSGIWTKQAYIKANNSDEDDRFGFSVDLSRDGTLVTGSQLEDSGVAQSGAVYIY